MKTNSKNIITIINPPYKSEFEELEAKINSLIIFLEINPLLSDDPRIVKLKMKYKEELKKY